MTGFYDTAKLRILMAALASFLVLTVLSVTAPVPAGASTQNAVQTPGLASDTEFWSQVRKGQQGKVSIPDKNAAQLIQSEGQYWRYMRNGPISNFGAMAIFATLLVLCLFFLARGRIMIEGGWSGWTVERFNNIERLGHWLLAISFIILGLTGLNMLYGRHVLLPIMSPEAFAMLTEIGKFFHNYGSFAFMLGLVWVLVIWIKDNIPGVTDLKWIAKGGGIFKEGVHPPSKRFNAGQKIIFWLVILCGISISASGLALLFPYQIPLFAKTFAILNGFGFSFASDVTPLQELQLAQLWHTIVSVFMICVILAHIYIGSVGMQGAFSAMGSGRVDLNWARQHHNLWVDKLEAKGELNLEPGEDQPDAPAQPAE